MVVEDAVRADVLIAAHVIVEVESVERVAPVHRKQLLTFLRLTNRRVGLLLNAGAEPMKDGVTRVVDTDTPSSSPRLGVDRPRCAAETAPDPLRTQKLLRDAALRASASRSPRLRVKTLAM